MEVKLSSSQSPKLLRKFHLKNSSNPNARESSLSNKSKKNTLKVFAKLKPDSTSARNYLILQKQKTSKATTDKIKDTLNILNQKTRKKISNSLLQQETIKASTSFHQQSQKIKPQQAGQQVDHQKFKLIPYSQLLNQANEIKQKIKQMSLQKTVQSAKANQVNQITQKLDKQFGLRLKEKPKRNIIKTSERSSRGPFQPRSDLSSPKTTKAQKTQNVKQLIGRLSLGINQNPNSHKIENPILQLKKNKFQLKSSLIQKANSQTKIITQEQETIQSIDQSLEKNSLNLSAACSSSRNQSFQQNNQSAFSVRGIFNNLERQNSNGSCTQGVNTSNFIEIRANQNISFTDQVKKQNEMIQLKQEEKNSIEHKKSNLQVTQKINQSFKEKYDNVKLQSVNSQQSQNSTSSSFSILKDLKSDINDANSEQNSTISAISTSSIYQDQNISVFQVQSAKNFVKEQPKVLFQKLKLPTKASVVLQQFKEVLTIYEHSEIMDYPQIFCIGVEAQKIRGNSLVSDQLGFDDERGDLRIILKDHIAYRYEILEVLGKGSFGQVVKVFDYKRKEYQALKIIRNKKRFHHQAAVEVRILSYMTDKDTGNQYNIIHIKNYFVFRKHLCITFELLSSNLYEVIKKNNFQGLSLGLIKRIAVQILQGLYFLRQNRIIHCDLKPENILLKHQERSNIKIVDFGSSCFQDERLYTYIQSRFYRAPEIILGLPYDMSCILAELHSGYPLFPGENEIEQLLCMMEILGNVDEEMIEKSPRKRLFFDSDNQPKIVSNSRGRRRYPSTKTLSQGVKSNDNIFLDFLSKCLV